MGQAVTTLTGKNPHISAFGEMVALLCAQGRPEGALRLENSGTTSRECTHVTPLCLSDERFDRKEHGDIFVKICAEHSHLIPVESYTELVSEEQRLQTSANCSKRHRRSKTRWRNASKLRKRCAVLKPNWNPSSNSARPP